MNAHWRGPKTRTLRCGGFTVVELLVTLAMTAAVTGAVFTTWNWMNGYIAHRKRRAVVQNDAERLTRLVVDNIRRSSEVVRWSRNEVTFIHHVSGDTVSYEYDGSVLRRNGAPTALQCRSCEVTDFSLEREATGAVGGEQSSSVLVELHLALAGAAGDTVSQRVKLTLPERDETMSADELDGWNFW